MGLFRRLVDGPPRFRGQLRGLPEVIGGFMAHAQDADRIRVFAACVGPTTATQRPCADMAEGGRKRKTVC